MKCVKCNCVATKIIPERLCNYHWARWWTEGMLDFNVLIKESKVEEASRALEDAIVLSALFDAPLENPGLLEKYDKLMENINK